MARRSYFNTIAQRAQPGVPTIAPARRLAHGWDVSGAPEAAPVKAQVSRRIDVVSGPSALAPAPPSPQLDSVVVEHRIPAAPTEAPRRQPSLSRGEAMNEGALPAEPIVVQRELAPSAHRAAPPPVTLNAPAASVASAAPVASATPIARVTPAAPAAPVAAARSVELRAPARGESRQAPAATALATALGAAMQWVSTPQADAAPPAPREATIVKTTTPTPPAAREPRLERGPAPTSEALPTRMPQTTKLGSPPARSIHIGSIDIQIVKPSTAPPPSPAPRTERAAAAGAPSAPTSPLARGFASPLGLRQS
jgi:hypothetical protein